MERYTSVILNMKSEYSNKDHQYTNPASYDARKQRPLEQYLDELWQPIIASIARQYITDKDVVCDFGCGTLAHYESMKQAKLIYAIDANNQMLEHGLSKIPSADTQKIIPIIVNAEQTGISPSTCSVVWSIGLTEYTNLDALFQEMTRVSSPHSTLLLQFPNAYHPMHLLIAYISPLLGKKPKRFRTYREIATTAKKYGWNIQKKYITGFYFPIPTALIPLIAPIWKLGNQIGNNVFIVATKSTEI